MNNTQAIYDGIIDRLEQLMSAISINEMETWCNNDEEKLTHLYDTEEKLNSKLSELQAYRDANTLYSDFNDIYDTINTSVELLSKQSCTPVYDLLLSLNLASRLVGSFETIDDQASIPFSEFKLFNNITHYIDTDFYLYIGSPSYSNTIIFLNLKDEDPGFINESHAIPDSIVILILGLLKNHSIEQCKKLLIIKKDSSEVSLNKAIACLKLHLVCSGKSYHKVEVTNRNNLSSFKNTINIAHNYNQFDDSLMILSEYNSRNELLNKYLSMYHLVENFMCRYPLVKLQSQYQGNMFSIRNFRDMYDDLDGKEIHMIRGLFKKIYSNEYKSSAFLLSAHDRFKKLLTNSIMIKADIDNAMLTLGMVYKGTALTYDTINGYSDGQVKSEFPQKLADMVYGIRNAIVHNKETEFHLSHEYMEPCIYTFINSFVLSILEEILLDLIIEKNNIIWYPHSKIKLYEE